MSAPESRPAGRPRRKGKVVLKPSDLDEQTLDVLRRELAELRAAHNDLVWQLNRQSRWLASFAEMWRKAIRNAPWRYCLWILPVAIAPYEPHEEVPYLQVKDAKPDYTRTPVEPVDPPYEYGGPL